MMNALDLVLGTTLIIGLFRGFWKGFVSEVASLLAVILGIYGAIHFSFFIGGYLAQTADWDKQTIQVVAFGLTLLGIMILVGLLGKIITKLLEASALGFVNRLFGGLFGALKWLLIVGAVLVFFARTHISLLSDTLKETSVLYKPVSEISNLVFSAVFPE